MSGADGNKRHFVVFTGSARIEGSRNAADQFVIAGEGHLRTRLEAEAGELGLGDSMLFLGNRTTDTDRIYAGLDIVALTSLNEGTPLSLIEAMAAGRPVISTMVGGVRDLLGETTEEHEGFRVCERGIGIDSRSATDYTKGLIYLVKNEKLRERSAEDGRLFVGAAYSKDRLVEDIKQLYRRLTPELSLDLMEQIFRTRSQRAVSASL